MDYKYIDKTRYIILPGKFILTLLILLLLFLLFTIRYGYQDSPENMRKKAYLLTKTPIPSGYKITYVTNIPLMEILVIDNLKTQQRIVFKRAYFRKGKKPEAFRSKYFHLRKQIKLKPRTFTAINNPWIDKTYKIKQHPAVDVHFLHKGKKMEGSLMCCDCPRSNLTFYIESSAPQDTYSSREVLDFVTQIITSN